jgi:ParB/RepB/Spo0J family partition protein
MTELSNIPLDKLTVHPDNVRKKGTKNITALTESIRNIGLIQPLIVIPNGTGYMVVDGQRRLHALMKIDEYKNWTKTIPCIVHPKNADVTALSLTSNFQQLPMAPLDQFKAFTKLVNEDNTPAVIATMFGVTELFIKQRLRLARLSPEIFKAYEDKKIDWDMVEAFCLCDSKKRQVELLDRVGPWFDAAALRRELKHKRFDVANALFDLELYKGEKQTDLFDDTVLLMDMEQALRLQSEAIPRIEQRYKDEGWSFVTVSDEYYHLGNYRKAFGYEKTVYNKKERAESGVYLHFTPETGSLTTHWGIIKTNDTAGDNNEIQQQKEKDQRIETDTGEKASQFETTPWPQTLVNDITALYKAVFGRAIGLDTRIAKEIVVLNFMNHRTAEIKLHPIYLGEWVEEQLKESDNNKNYRERAGSYKTLLGISKDRSLLGIDITPEICARIAKLNDRQLDELLALLVGPAFNVGNPDQYTAWLHKRLKLNLADQWRPTYAFWDRLSKKQIAVEVSKLVGSAAIPTIIEGKKEEICLRLASLFDGNAMLNKLKRVHKWDQTSFKTAQTNLKAWLPERWKLKTISSKHSKKS